jgi:hypothetical protein
MGWVKLQHGSNQVLEFLAEEVLGLIFRMGLPKEVSSVCTNQSVEGVSWLSSSEGWVLSEHDKENDSSGKQVN